MTNGLEQALERAQPALAGVSIDTGLFSGPRPTHELRCHNLRAGGGRSPPALALLALVALLLEARAVAVGARFGRALAAGAALCSTLLGYTLNALVVLGLLLASAVVVDDAVGATE